MVIPSEMTGKKYQILEGARSVFLTKGFDGASIADIVQEAHVSKGTLYAHFSSKEKLFETLIFEDRRRQAEQLFDIDTFNPDIDTVLTELGQRFLTLISSKESIAHLRIVIAVAGRFPDIGQAYYEAGPQFGIHKLSAYLQVLVERKVLVIEHLESAACQFMDLCKSGLHLPLILGHERVLEPEKIIRNVEEAVNIFLLRYRA